MILIVSMPVGGVETQLLSIAGRLSRERYNITICCIKELGELGRKAAETGINTISLDLMKSSRFSPGIALQVSRVLKEHNIHILWTHQYVANLYGRLAALAAKTPVVISSFHALYDTPKFHRRLFNYLLSKKTDALVAVSEAVASDMISHDRVRAGQVRVIYNGTDLSLFDIPESKADCRKKLGLPEDAVIVGTIGRMSGEKNQKLMIEALNKLPANVKGMIIGDGPLRKSLQESGGGRFYFPGPIPYNEVPVALKAMDIFCLPSLWEGMPLALIEAMAAGLPIVASDIASHREVLDDAGIFTSPDDAELIAKTIQTLIDDSSVKDMHSARARERAKVFSIDSTVASYERLFDEILVKKGLL